MKSAWKNISTKAMGRNWISITCAMSMTAIARTKISIVMVKSSARIDAIGNNSRGNHTRVMRPPAFTIEPVAAPMPAEKKDHGTIPARRNSANESIPLGSPAPGVAFRNVPSTSA